MTSPVARWSRAPKSGANVTRGCPAAVAGPDPQPAAPAVPGMATAAAVVARGEPAAAAGPETESAASAGPGMLQLVNGSAWDVLHVEAELLDLVEPAREEAVDVPLGAQPRDRLVVGSEREVRKDPRRTGSAAAKQVVSKHAQGLYHRQQLEDVGRVNLLRPSNLRLS